MNKKQRELEGAKNLAWLVVEEKEDELERAKRELEKARKVHYELLREFQDVCDHKFNGSETLRIEECTICGMMRTNYHPNER